MLNARRRDRRCFLVGAVLLSGCTGAIGGSSDDGPPAHPSSSGGAGARVGGAGSGGTGTPQVIGDAVKPPPSEQKDSMMGHTADGTQLDCSAGIPVPQVGVRRLTNAEYTDTLRDLFPGVTFTLPPLAPEGQNAVKGFYNNWSAQTVTPVHVEAYQRAAVVVTDAAVKTLGAKLLGCDVAKGTSACGDAFLASFGKRLFRRPLTSDESTLYGKFFHDTLAAANFNVAIQTTMQAMLQAPAFLYRLELGNGGSSDPVALTDHEIAARLSYLLWGSAPDDALLKAADDGTLKTVAGREAQARRMLKDARARRAWVAFTRQWLDSARLLDVQKTQKDPATFPDWSEQMRADVVSAQDRFVESAAFDGDGRLESLLTSTRHFVNPLLATKLYGVGAPAGSDFAGVDVPNRPGLLTTAGFLAGEAHPVNPSPVLRGVFIMDRLLCSPPPNPPANVNTTIATGANAPKTNRERYAAHATSASCAACHTAIDGFGFPFESFDAIGRFRTSDGGSAVDTAGVVKGAGNVDGDVANVGELMTKLSQSSNVHACVTTQMFRYAFGKVEEDRDRCAIQTLDGGFAAGKNDVKELLVAVVKSSVFALRAVAP